MNQMLPSNEIWPEQGLEYLGHCPVCDSVAREIQYEKLKDQLFSAPGLWTMYRCNSCNTRYLDPRPNAETIALAYQKYYTHQNVTGNTGKTLRSLIKLGLKNGFMNNVWKSSFTPAFPWVAKFLSLIYPGWTKVYERQVLRDLPKSACGRLLDVGCGNGAYIKLIKELGWQVQGIDFDESALEVAKKLDLDVMMGDISLFDGKQELFDVITANHVIEHLHDPLKFLYSCLRLLKKGGVLRLESPNFSSVGSNYFGASWRGLEPPRHLVLFTSENMQKILSKVGFREIKHAGWMPQYRPMFQLSKNLQFGCSQEAGNLTILEKLKVIVQDWKLHKTVSRREFFTFICIK